MFKQTQIKSDFLLEDKYKDLLLKECPDTVFDFDQDNLSLLQKKAFQKFKEGENIAIIGSAGVGKSKLIKTFEKHTKTNTNKKIAVCATTGIAAYNINGVTIHSFCGIGTGDGDVEYLIKKVYRKKLVRDKIVGIDIIILDEASMLSAELFEKLNIICQSIRKNKMFFGGIQLVLSFDPLQLLPVFNKNTELYKEIDERLIIESTVFNANYNTISRDNIILLKENFRQDDTNFVELLLRIRNGSFTQMDIDTLNKRKIKSKSGSIHLVSSNKEAQSINEKNLKKLKGDVLKSSVRYESTKHSDLSDILIREFQSQFKQKNIDTLSLSVGARVMLIKNLNVESGLVNGAIGTITNIVNGSVVVQFDNGQIHPITAVSWELEVDDTKVTARQIPLMLAYAITISKSQSLTLESAVLDLENCFLNHQVYVALSRVKTLNGLYLKSFNPSKITVNQKMKNFVESL